MNTKGITLVEILVVIAVLSIMAIIAVPQYSKWKRQYSIEDDTKKIYGIIQQERMKAFSQKINVAISVGTKNITIKENGVKTDTVNLKNNFSGGPVNIDTRGTLGGSSIYYNSPAEGLNPQYDCIAVDDVRAKLGEWNGNQCTAK